MTTTRILGLATIVSMATLAQSALDGNRYLWYTSPAVEWETGSLPIGNGRLGCTIFGSSPEVLTLNEDTLWSGPFQDRVPNGGPEKASIAREMFEGGDLKAADDYTGKNLNPSVSSERMFSYFGSLNLALGHSDRSMKDYVRWLDTRVGNSGVSYTYDGVKYTREYVASVPAGVIVARFTSGDGGALNLNASISRTEGILSNQASNAGKVHTVTMSGTSGQPANEGPILFTGQARFVPQGGSVSTANSTLVIEGASVIDMFIDIETNYRYSSQDDLEAEIDRKLTAAASQGFEKVRGDALADSTALLERASLDLGKSPDGLADLPTNERVDKARLGYKDIQLTTLVWNYARHLQVAGSRNTEADIDMPLNLQGVWNNVTSPPWGGKYTININIEMNYWSTMTTNIIETQEPLFDLMKVAHSHGASMAKRMYNCSGVMYHHNLDVWGDPGPTDAYESSTMWPMGAAWLVQHMIEHYRFTGDKEFLASTAYPYLLDVAAFYHCYTFNYEGFLVTGPSLSPENTYAIPKGYPSTGQQAAMDINVPMDDQLMTDIFRAIIEFAKALGKSRCNPDVRAAKAFLKRIRPTQIGSWGQIMEWRDEYDETDVGHRHLSPLYALHPSVDFSPLKNKTLADAAGVLLDHRLAGGSGSTGWSCTWFINMYARLFRSADAWAMIVKWFGEYPTHNLWNTNGGTTFQIDGNFGFASGLTEMILQSHAGVIHLLPALPFNAIPAGGAKGLLARGNFEIDIEWADEKFDSATITSNIGGKLALRVENGRDIIVDDKAYEGPVQTVKGAKYVVKLA